MASVKYTLDISDKNALEAMCKEHSFIKRGQSYFRLHKSDVLQVVKFQYERCFNHYSLDVGLLSMYSAPYREYYGSKSVLPRYSICCLNGQSTAIAVSSRGWLTEFNVISPQAQLDILNKKGFDWLDSIKDQGSLFEALCYLDQMAYKAIVWNDARKLAPCLFLRDYQNANMIISSILDQHLGPKSFSPPPWSNDDYSFYASTYPLKDSDLLLMHRWIQQKDERAIQEYLIKNKTENCRHLGMRDKKTEDGSLSWSITPNH